MSTYRVPKCGRHFVNSMTSLYIQFWLWPGLLAYLISEAQKNVKNDFFNRNNTQTAVTNITKQRML